MKFVFMALMMVFTLTACEPSVNASETGDATKSLTIVSRDGKPHVFHIELALTPHQYETGLMGRTEMAKDAGMLFFFSTEEERGFWMKNTLIPLDMIFIKRDGTIQSVHDSAKPNDLTTIRSNGPVLAVLELNGGVAKKFGIVAGDKVKHPFFGN